MKIGKAEMLVTNLPDKNECVIHIKKLKAKIKSWINGKKIS